MIDSQSNGREFGVREHSDERHNSWLTVTDRLNGGIASYDVVMSRDLLNEDNPTLKQSLDRAKADDQSKVHVVFSPSAFRLIGSRVRNYLNRYSVRHTCISLMKQPVSEMNKSFECLEYLATQLDAREIRKGDTLLVVGGGVVMDLTGYHASTWRRGGHLSYVALPTTVTAAIDAALSPKTAINLGNQKNYYGTYYAPKAVLVDNSLFATLNRQAVLDGVAEMIKVAVIGDSELFETLESQGVELIRDSFQSLGSAEVILRAARLFLSLRWDRRFRGAPTSIRSFGHFFSREIEGTSGFQLSHGQAVSIEMRIATHLGTSIGQLSYVERDRILACFDRLGLAHWSDSLDCDTIWSRVFAGLVENGQHFGFPIPFSIGLGGYLEWFGHHDLKRAMRDCRDQANGCVISTRQPS